MVISTMFKKGPSPWPIEVYSGVLKRMSEFDSNCKQRHLKIDDECGEEVSRYEITMKEENMRCNPSNALYFWLSKEEFDKAVKGIWEDYEVDENVGSIFRGDLEMDKTYVVERREYRNYGGLTPAVPCIFMPANRNSHRADILREKKHREGEKGSIVVDPGDWVNAYAEMIEITHICGVYRGVRSVYFDAISGPTVVHKFYDAEIGQEFDVHEIIARKEGLAFYEDVYRVYRFYEEGEGVLLK